MRHQPLHRKSKGRRVNPPLLWMALSKPLSCRPWRQPNSEGGLLRLARRGVDPPRRGRRGIQKGAASKNVGSR